MSQILIIDDEPAICWSLKEGLADHGHVVQFAASIERAEKILDSFEPDVFVLDVRLPGQDGLSAIAGYKERYPNSAIVVITAFGDLQTVVDAMNRGAFEYLVKPFDLIEFRAVIDRALRARGQENHRTSKPSTRNQLIGHGPAMQAVFKRIALVAPTEFPVLITGETGTGKELVAEAVHNHSRRRSGPFSRVSLASLSPSIIESELFGHVKGAFTGAAEDRVGLFELSENGTIFLDEISETPPAIQVKLLRVLESRSFSRVGSGEEQMTNARLIAASNRNLTTMIGDGTFREDLYHRLKVFSIELPPLREHREDLRSLVEYFLIKQGAASGTATTDDFWPEIESRSWNGNIRELRNAVDHAVVLARGGPISAEHLPKVSVSDSTSERPGGSLQSAIASWVRLQLADSEIDTQADLYRKFLTTADAALLNEILSFTQQNRSAAAKLLGLDRATLRTKLGTLHS